MGGGFGRSKGAEIREDQVKRMVGDAFRVARVSLLKLQPTETRFCSASVRLSIQID